MKLLLKLAWRNIWRNKRRSFLTLLAISFATTAAIATRGMQLGTYAVNIDYAVNMFSGYLQIQREGFQENPSLNKAFKLNKLILSILKKNNRIKSWSPRVLADGLISYKENSQGAAIFGLNPQTEKHTTKIFTRIKKGKFFESDSSNEIIIGYKLLQNLKAGIGDTVVILSQGFDGSLGNLKFVIAGTVKFGSPGIDGMGVFMPIKTAQELLALYGRIHAVVINLYDTYEIEKTKELLSEKLHGTGLTVLDWGEIMPDFKQAIELDNVSGILMLFILMVIVAFGILNTVLMSVTERFREFGVTLAIGMSQIKLMILVFLETVFLTLIGIFLGNVAGYFINLYFVRNPIEFSGELSSLYEEYGFLPVIRSTLEPSIFLNISIAVLLISLFVTIYPVYKVYKLEPLKGIRYT